MGATKINHEQNHIGPIVDYLRRIDHEDTEILRYWISITSVLDIVVRGKACHNSVSHKVALF